MPRGKGQQHEGLLKLQRFFRIQEQVLKGTQYTSAVMSLTGKSFATAADGTLRELHEGQVLRSVDLPSSINGCALSRTGKLLLTVLGSNPSSGKEGQSFNPAANGAVVGVRVPLTNPPEIQARGLPVGLITLVSKLFCLPQNRLLLGTLVLLLASK